MTAPALSPDAIVARAYQALATAPDLPTGLKVLDHDLLPAEPDEMPVVGVYLAEDKLGQKIDHRTQDRNRVATIRVEIRAIGPMLTATLPIREWVLNTLLGDQQLFDLCIKPMEFESYTPYGLSSNVRFAGADMDFLATYDFTVETTIYGP